MGSRHRQSHRVDVLTQPRAAKPFLLMHYPRGDRPRPWFVARADLGAALLGLVECELLPVVVEVLGRVVVDVSQRHDVGEEWVPSSRKVHA